MNYMKNPKDTNLVSLESGSKPPVKSNNRNNRFKQFFSLRGNNKPSFNLIIILLFIIVCILIYKEKYDFIVYLISTLYYIFNRKKIPPS